MPMQKKRITGSYQKGQVKPCVDCGENKPSYMCITVDDEEHHRCEQCWQKVRENFMAQVDAGDKRALKILSIVTQAYEAGIRAEKGKKQ